MNGIQYRVFGAIKQMNYKTDDNALVSMQYDNRLRVSQHQVASNVQTGGYLKKATFEYFSDSRPKAMDNEVEAAFDRSFSYDFAGRLTFNQFGLTNDGQGQEITPYFQSISYDAFSQMIGRNTAQWGDEAGFGRSYQNGRLTARTGETLTYDAAGNIVYQGTSANLFQQTTHDAAGRRVNFTERWVVNSPTIIVERVAAQTFDGNGEAVKRVETLRRVGEGTVFTKTVYQVYSSVLGSVLTEIEIDGFGERRTTKVFAGGAVIAEQKSYPDTPSSNAVIWIHADPLTGSKQEVVKAGTAAGGIKAREEYEPLGQSVRPIAPIVLDPPGSSPTPITNAAGFPEWQCALPLQIIPSQCGLRILAKEEFVLGIWSESAEGNASKIPDLELFSVSDEETSEVLTPTAKPDERVENEIARVQSLPADDPLLGADASQLGNDNQKLVDRAISDVKDIFRSDNECSRFFEQAFQIPTIHAANNPAGGRYEPSYDATPAAETLGNQLRNNIGLLSAGKVNNTTIGIEMSNRKGGGITVSRDGLRYNQYDSAKVNIRGPFITTGKFGDYSGRAGRALAILHEIAHMIITGVERDKKGKIIGSTYLIIADGDEDGKQSMRNTEIIQAKCKKELDTLK